MTFTGCGIAGVLRFGDCPRDAPGLPEVRLMTRALAHRGPDGGAVWHSANVALGHRRLSFLDLGDGGAQPMTRDGFTIVYNGELYNFAGLRAELAHSYRFESGSDTEVVIRAWQRWGPRALERFNGMFAFALWDAHSRRLVLVRDRIGIKPLYYYRGRGFIAFASEVEALLQCGQVLRRPHLDALCNQLLRSSTLEPDRSLTLIEGVRSVRPAGLITIGADGRENSRTYWELQASADTAGAPASGLRELVDDAVRSMLIADVPIAAFLSGGLDSSSINVIAAQVSRVTAITVAYAGRAAGLPSEDTNEDLRYSRILARHCADRIDHRVAARANAVTLPDVDAVCDLATLCDDVRHVSILGNYQAVCSLGFRGVLNGQGADETMGGYVGLPSFVRHILDVRAPSPDTITTLPAARQVRGLSREVIARRSHAHLEVLEFCASLPGEAIERAHRLLVHTQLARVVQFEDFLGMRASVEGRFPFLDHRIVEWAFARPFSAHIDAPSRSGKVLLRDAMRTSLPEPLNTRRKQVFPYPEQAGLRQSLTALAGCHEDAIRGDGLVAALFTLPAPGQLSALPADTLWVVLSLWRWHERLRATGPAAAHGRAAPTRLSAPNPHAHRDSGDRLPARPEKIHGI